MGHVCTNEVKLPVRKWVAKPVLEEVRIETSKEKNLADSNKDRHVGPILEVLDDTRKTPNDKNKWTEVSGKNRSKGKKVMTDPQTKHLLCTNGFGSIKVWNDLKEPPWEKP